MSYGIALPIWDQSLYSRVVKSFRLPRGMNPAAGTPSALKRTAGGGRSLQPASAGFRVAAAGFNPRRSSTRGEGRYRIIGSGFSFIDTMPAAAREEISIPLSVTGTPARVELFAAVMSTSICETG